MRRNPDVQFGSFMRQVEARTLALFGVGFSKIQQDLDPLEGPRFAEDAARGLTPAAFVDALASHYPLVKVAEGDEPDGVGRLNRGLMALGTFAREGLDWVQLADGAIYREDGGGVSRLVAAQAPAGEGYGFRAEHATGRAIGDDLAEVTKFEFSPAGGGTDISDALASLDRTLEAARDAARAPGL